MRKLTKGLIVTALLFSWGGTALTAAFAANLRDTLTAFRQKNLRENLNLRARLAQVESAVEAGADKLLGAGTEPDGNAVQADAPAQATPAESTSGRLPADTDGVGEVTHAGAHAAEEPVGTQPAEACAYRVTEYRGIIGVFDGDGRLMRTVNVRVDTLPAVDREALAAGIVAGTWQEMMDIVGQYARLHGKTAPPVFSGGAVSRQGGHSDNSAPCMEYFMTPAAVARCSPATLPPKWRRCRPSGRRRLS